MVERTWFTFDLLSTLPVDRFVQAHMPRRALQLILWQVFTGEGGAEARALKMAGLSARFRSI